MNKTMNTGNRFLDSLKRVLVRFKDAGFGIKFIKGNIGIENGIRTFPYFCTFLLKRYIRSLEE